MNQFSSISITPSDEWPKVLSNREFNIALLVARGLSNKKVAHELGLREGTVKVHLHRIFQKLGAKRRYDLIGALIRTGVPDVEARTPRRGGASRPSLSE